MSRHATLFAATLALLACSPLTGRTVSDGGLDVAVADAGDARDARVGTDVGDDRPVAPRDVASAPSDAPRCPLGEGTVLDPRINVTLRDMGPGSAFASHAISHVVTDDDDNLYLVGTCRGCATTTSLEAAVWRLTADGRLDAQFGVGGIALEGGSPSSIWYGATLDGERRLIAVGQRARGVPGLARFTPDGRPDASVNAAWLRALPLRALGGTELQLFGVAVDPAGVVAVGGNGSVSDRPSNAAVAVRVTTAGALDPNFANGGALLRGDLHGCYDVVRDGDAWVLGCISSEDRPALLRINARGGVEPWGSGAMLATHDAAPRGFQLRALQRDSAGRWIAVGAIARVYNDTASPPAAVRFGADGTPDLRYGVEGVATLLGARQTFAYSFASSAWVGCEDRLLLGLALGAQTGVAVFDRDGRLMPSVGDEGVIFTNNPPAVVGITISLVPTRARDALTVLTAYGGPAFSMLHRMRL
ncbi:MAG: hypothetical protein U0325_25070 [Polyangiales bacterium]